MLYSEKPWILLKSAISSILASCIPHSVSCRSIQNPPKGVETVCWMVRRAFCILPEHTESPKRRGNCILDGPACILDLAGAYRILQKAWKLYLGRSGVHSGSCRSIQNPPKGVETVCWTVRRAFCILPEHTESPKRRGNCMLDGPACILDLAPSSSHTQRQMCITHDARVPPQNPQHSCTWILHPATREVGKSR
jgi:hypothetical protein